MSLNHRINKLEHKHGHGFRVAYPVLLDASDQKFTECPDKSQIAAALFKCNGQEIRIKRKSGEAYNSFQSRATDEVKSHFDCIIILPFDAAWV